MKLSPQEHKVLEFLSSKQEVYWEELAQFCKDPSTVKLKTVKKIVSDLKKKFQDNKLPIPFSCHFSEITKDNIAAKPKMLPTNKTVDFNGQTLVQIKRPPLALNRNSMNLPSSNASISTNTSIVKTSIPDFLIKPYSRQVLTKSGLYTLNDDEFEVFNYLYQNSGKFISLEELRDKVCYPKFGSKIPPRWFYTIQRRIGNIRHQIPETRNRLLTAKQQNISGYIFN